MTPRRTVPVDAVMLERWRENLTAYGDRQSARTVVVEQIEELLAADPEPVPDYQVGWARIVHRALAWLDDPVQQPAPWEETK